jgi:hypothetical protein
MREQPRRRNNDNDDRLDLSTSRGEGWPMDLSTVNETLSGSGLFVRGALHVRDEDRAPLGAKTLVLVGNAGTAMWQAFRAQVSETPRNGRAHPLDSWVRSKIEAAAVRLGAEAVFPFDGPPFPPFQRWAMRAEPVHASPLGILIHPAYGLWHAYRGALAFRELLPLPPRGDAGNPCDSCRDKPCLRSCPVGAFGAYGYDVPACVAHVRSASGRACLDRGCAARRACPVGSGYRYEAAQAMFHMRGFLASVE